MLFKYVIHVCLIHAKSLKRIAAAVVVVVVAVVVAVKSGSLICSSK